jgi:SHS2 domain-containing protein
MGSYEVLEHTADLALSVRGTSVEDLFATAARAMFESLTDAESIDDSTEVEIQVSAPEEGREGLLVEWLRELLFRLATEEMLFSRFDIVQLTEGELVARCGGERIDPARHQLRLEIKSVTYHGLHLARQPEGWTATLLFDI